jgi:hypothetical protein
MKPRMGRPPKPLGEVKTEVFTTRCTLAEKELYEQLKTKLDQERKDQQKTEN